MTYHPETADTISSILGELMDALVALEGCQDEDNDRPALELVQLVAVDIQDAIDNIDADPPHPLFDAAGELAYGTYTPPPAPQDQRIQPATHTSEPCQPARKRS